MAGIKLPPAQKEKRCCATTQSKDCCGVLPSVKPPKCNNVHKHFKFLHPSQRCVGFVKMWPRNRMLRACCKCVTRNAANSGQTSTLLKKIQQNHPNTVNVTDSPRAKKSKRNVDDFFAGRETSKASPHSVPPDS